MLRTLALLGFLSAALLAQDTGPATVTLEQYGAELQRIASGLPGLEHDPALGIPLAATIPPAYIVADETGSIEVDTSRLRRELTGFAQLKPAQRAGAVERLTTWLQHSREQAARFADPKLDASAKLREILARREFGKVRGPNPLEVWWNSVRERIWSWIRRLFGNIPRGEQAGQIAVWVVIALAACVLVIYLKRMAERAAREHEPTREIVRFAPSARHWRTWLNDARAAAAAGDHRLAIHHAYWAAVSYLESSGRWVPSPARTPREYIALLPSGGKERNTLSGMTGMFERIWYGCRPAGQSDFAEVLARVEDLGCR